MHDVLRDERWNDSGEHWAESVGVAIQSALLRSVKRALDLLGALVGTAILAPVLLGIAALIRIDSPGPVLFRQTRVGLRGRKFEMLKFRTMRDGCDSASHEAYVSRMICGAGDELRNGEGVYKLENDGRITGVGRWLRRLSLDELPQLLNVAHGEMSLVGPRPPLPYEVELYSERHLRRLDVVPGITGLWQVSGRNETTFEEMIDLDLDYIAHWSPLLDLRIIGRTFVVLITERGA